MKTPLDFSWPKHSLLLDNLEPLDEKQILSVNNQSTEINNTKSIKFKKGDCFNNKENKKENLIQSTEIDNTKLIKLEKEDCFNNEEDKKKALPQDNNITSIKLQKPNYFNNDEDTKRTILTQSINIDNNITPIKLEKSEYFNNEESDKRNLLSTLKEKMISDTNIVFANQCNNFVFSDGNINSNVMFIGEAPGEEEDLKGIPFVGRSGQLLRYFLKEAKINDVYITNIVPWRPPHNRTPTIQEINFMQPYIFEHIKIINPKITIVVGTTSLKALNINKTITKAQGNLFETEIGKIYPIYHPSYALRVSAKKKELWYSLLKLHSLLHQK